MVVDPSHDSITNDRAPSTASIAEHFQKSEIRY